MITVSGRDFTFEAVKSSNKVAVVIKNPTYAQGKPITRKDDFEACKFDLIEIKNAIDGDTYMNVAVGKYVDLIFKEGWYLHSKNPKSKEYVIGRLDNIASITKKPTAEVLDETARGLVAYANAYTRIKMDDASVISPSTNLVMNGNDSNKVISGLFPVHPASMYILRDQNNNIIKYQQRDIAQSSSANGTNTIPDKPSGGDIKEWPIFIPEEVLHMTVAKESGYVCGNPYLAPALDDIKALRMIEEQSARLIYRHLFPTPHVQVGLPQPGMQAGEEEVKTMESKISEVPYDGTIVTSERVNIHTVGASGYALDPIPTLKHYEDRSFTGIGVSPVQMGRSESSNRATADALTTEMHDRIITYQNRISMFMESLFNMLLTEGNFDISDPNNRVALKWNSIEIETKIKKEAHTVFKYNNDAITIDELRNELGYDVYTPEEESRRKSVLTSEILKDQMAQSIVQPTNQHGTRSGPKKKSEKVIVENLENGDAIVCYDRKLQTCLQNIEEIYRVLEGDVKTNRNKKTIQYGFNRMHKKFSNFISASFNDGVLSIIKSKKQNNMKPSHKYFEIEVINDAKDMFDFYADILHESVKDVDNKLVSPIMESMMKRIARYVRTHLHGAYQRGIASGCRTSGVKATVVSNGDCEICKEYNGKEVEFNGVQFNNSPGFHMNCTCGLKVA